MKLNFSAWLNSSQSRLGTGIKLTVFVRVNGGNWHSAVLKQGSDSWSGTAKHSASLTISADLKTGTAKIEFYVSRTGSSYSGTAGILGSSSNPKSYAAALPAYSSGNTGSEVPPTGGDVPPTPDTDLCKCGRGLGKDRTVCERERRVEKCYTLRQVKWRVEKVSFVRERRWGLKINIPKKQALNCRQYPCYNHRGLSRVQLTRSYFGGVIF